MPAWSLALLSALALAIWLATGTVAHAPPPPAEPANAALEVARTRVRATLSRVTRVAREIRIHGALEPRRRVTLRAETTGVIEQLLKERGARVKADEPIALLAEEDRQARLAAAERDVEHQQAELAAARQMHARGLQAETQRLAAEAALAEARAERAMLAAELARIRITAPFAGVLTARPVERGSLVVRGDVIAELVDDSTLLAVAQAPQQLVANITIGQTVQVHLLDGRTVTGRVRYVGRVADEVTRSFRIEAEVPNPDGHLPGGLSADLVVTAGEVEAHALGPSQLTLDDAGRLGIKAVDGADRVVFHPVQMVQARADRIWVSGLPMELRLITEGQSLVAPGEAVAVVGDPVDVSTEAAGGQH